MLYFRRSGAENTKKSEEEHMKNKRSLAALVAGIAVILFTAAAFAGNTNDPGFHARIEQQQKRIDQGMASGQLTKDEAAIVQDNLDKIKAAEAKMKSDGKFTERERLRLEKMLDRNSSMILKEKHNAIRHIE